MSLLAALMDRPGNLKLLFPAVIQLDFRRVGSTLLKLGVGKSQRRRGMRALRSSRGWLRRNLGSSVPNCADTTAPVRGTLVP